jgi:hypothetical protein
LEVSENLDSEWRRLWVALNRKKKGFEQESTEETENTTIVLVQGLSCLLFIFLDSGEVLRRF